MALHLSWFYDIVIMNKSYPYMLFDNRRLAKQHSCRLVIEKVQVQLRKNKQRTKDKQETKNKQETKDKQKTEDKQATKNKQKDKKTGVDKANKLDESNESGELNCLFMLIIYAQYQRFCI